MTLTIGFSFLIFGFSIRGFEIGLVDECNRFYFISNSLWLIIQTMSMGKPSSIYRIIIVGYGDVTPKTHLGRLLCVFACLMGVVALSLFVASMTNMTDFSPKED